MIITNAQYGGKSDRIEADHYRALVLLTFEDGSQQAEWFDLRGSTVDEMRADCTRQIDSRNSGELQGRALALAIQQLSANAVIPVALTPPVTLEPSAFDVWRVKAQRLGRLKMLGLTAAAALDDVAKLEADVNATYQAGFAGQL